MNIHEPEIVTDVKNAVGWFLVISVLTCGLGFVIGGLFSPVFWSVCVEKAKELAKKEPRGSYEENLRKHKIQFAILLAIWFVFSWALLITVHALDGAF